MNTEKLFNKEVMSLDTYIMFKLKEETARLKDELTAKNRAPISLSMGAPTANPPETLIKRLKEIKKYYDKMNSSNSEKQKNYYLEGMKMLFDKGETVENFEEIFEQFKQALINKNEQIDKLNAELKEIRKLKI